MNTKGGSLVFHGFPAGDSISSKGIHTIPSGSSGNRIAVDMKLNPKLFIERKAAVICLIIGRAQPHTAVICLIVGRGTAL